MLLKKILFCKCFHLVSFFLIILRQPIIFKHPALSALSISQYGMLSLNNVPYFPHSIYNHPQRARRMVIAQVDAVYPRLLILMYIAKEENTHSRILFSEAEQDFLL
jgi:hypothetical protein